MHLCFKLWSDELPYEYLKMFLEARMLNPIADTQFCKTSLTHKAIADRSGIDFAGGVCIVPGPPPSKAHRCSFIIICLVASGTLLCLEQHKAYNCSGKHIPRNDKLYKSLLGILFQSYLKACG